MDERDDRLGRRTLTVSGRRWTPDGWADVPLEADGRLLLLG